MFSFQLNSKTAFTGMIFVITLRSIVISSSTTRQICNYFDGNRSPKLEIQCYNYNNLLRFNISLTDNIGTIKLIKNSITALDSSSFPNRSEAIERIFLNANKLNELPLGVLQKFPNLEVLDLTGNNLFELHRDVFLGLQHLREIYLDGNNFKILKLEPFRNLAKLERVTLEENPLEDCDAETLITLDEFRKRNIITDVPNLCNNLTLESDSLIRDNDAMLTRSVDLIEDTNLSANETPDFMEKLFYSLRKNQSYFFEAFLITVLSSVGLLTVIYIIRRRRNTKSINRTRTNSGKCLLEDEENGYLIPTKPLYCPTYLEVTPDRTSIRVGNFENNISQVHSKIYESPNHYEEITICKGNDYGKLGKYNENNE